jgi:hypothetical protein
LWLLILGGYVILARFFDAPRIAVAKYRNGQFWISGLCREFLLRIEERSST